MFIHLLRVLAAIAALTSPATAGPFTGPITQRALEPCAQIAAQLETQTKLNSTLALACLRSVPLDIKRNPDLLRAVRATVQFQSTLAYLKNPPPGALYPAVDILGGIDDIARKLNSGYYENEYDFQFDLYELSKSAHDFHFNLYIDITRIFTWRRAASLVSLSIDGTSLPNLYVASDMKAFDGSRGYTPAAITKIDGIDAETWINNYAGLDPLGHDPDANYNNVLYNAPLASFDGYRALGSFTMTNRPQRDQTVLSFSNGTQKIIDAYATTRYDFTGVVDGASFFSMFCGGVKSTTTPTNTLVAAVAVTPSSRTTASSTIDNQIASFTPVSTHASISIATIYPEPLVATSDLSVVGFLSKDRKDLAVLTISSFESLTAQSFQNTIRGFLATAQSQNRTNLVVDIRGNTGGYIYLGYDTFRQLFPTIMPFGSAQIRSHPVYRDVVAIYDRLPDDIADYEPGSPFEEVDFLDINEQPFSSVQSFYGPYETYGDNFTALERANLNRTSSTAPVDVYGFGSNTAPIPQVFLPENIVLLSDGFCGSTCALFAEFMKSQGGVKSVAVGGRKQDGAMQAIGGSKGAEVMSLAAISEAIDTAQVYGNATATSLLTTDLASLIPGLDNLEARSDHGEGVRVNFKNNIRQDDKSLTPLQYVYEAADCRFFYTPAMMIDQAKVWDFAADIHWANAACVPGSAGQPSSLSGDLIDHLHDYPPVGANYTFGAPDKSYPSGIANLASTPAPTISATMAATTGATKMDVSTTFVAASTTSSPTAAATSIQPANAAHVHSAGTSLSAIVALLATCLL